MATGNSSEKANADKYYVPPPQLPGVVYSLKNITKENLSDSKSVIFLTGLIFFVILSYLLSPNTSLLIKAFLALVLAKLFFTVNKKVHEVFLSPGYVTEKYGLNKKKQNTLEISNHVLLIDEIKKIHNSNHYSYGVFIAPNGYDGTQEKPSPLIAGNLELLLSMTIGPAEIREKKQDCIHIAPAIYSPENLKEYVESVNSQLSVKLPIVFGSEQVKKDYETGQYKTKLSEHYEQ